VSRLCVQNFADAVKETFSNVGLNGRV